MAELTTTLYLRLRSDIAGKANRDRRSLKHLGCFERLGRSGQRSFRRIEQSARHQRPQASRHGRQAALSTTSKIAAGLGAAGLATSALNQAIRREDQKAHLAATSGKSMAKVERIYESVTNNAIATGQSIEKMGQLLQSVQDMGGLLDVGVKTPKAPLRFFSNVMQGTGAAAQDVAGMATTLVKVLDVPLKKAFAILVEQGNQGSATLAQLARYAPAPLSIYKATTGRSGEQSVREVGAMLQMGTDALGSIEKSSTASRALIARLTEEENLDLMQRSGIETHDKDAQKRSLLAILADMAKLTEGDPSAQKRTARQLGIGVEELALFLSLLGKGLQKAQSLAAVPGSRSTIPKQAVNPRLAQNGTQPNPLQVVPFFL